jgi:hypothetical protein
VVSFCESHEIAIVRIIVFDQHSFVLQSNYCDPIPVVFGEGGNPQPERRPRSDLLPWRSGLAPIESVYRPLKFGTSGREKNRTRFMTHKVPRIVVMSSPGYRV